MTAPSRRLSSKSAPSRRLSIESAPKPPTKYFSVRDRKEKVKLLSEKINLLKILGLQLKNKFEVFIRE